MSNRGYQPAPVEGVAAKTLGQAISKTWMLQVVQLVNNMLRGKLNAVAQVTLAAGATTTVITDARISGFSALILQALTADAAAALTTSPYVLVTSQASGTATLTHANAASTDRNFNLLIIG